VTRRPVPLLDSGEWVFVLLVLLVISITACHSQAYDAAAILNAYDFREARYEEACVPYSTKPFCATAKARLDRFRAHAKETAAAVKNGGSAKLQLDLAKKDAKGLSDVE
jgi:hypothetical protein